MSEPSASFKTMWWSALAGGALAAGYSYLEIPAGELASVVTASVAAFAALKAIDRSRDGSQPARWNRLPSLANWKARRADRIRLAGLKNKRADGKRHAFDLGKDL